MSTVDHVCRGVKWVAARGRFEGECKCGFAGVGPSRGNIEQNMTMHLNRNGGRWGGGDELRDQADELDRQATLEGVAKLRRLRDGGNGAKT